MMVQSKSRHYSQNSPFQGSVVGQIPPFGKRKGHDAALLDLAHCGWRSICVIMHPLTLWLGARRIVGLLGLSK